MGNPSILFRSLRIVDVPERPGRVSPVLFIWGYYSSDPQIVTVLNLEPKSPNLANRFEKTDFRKEVPNMDCFSRYRVAT